MLPLLRNVIHSSIHRHSLRKWVWCHIMTISMNQEDDGMKLMIGWTLWFCRGSLGAVSILRSDKSRLHFGYTLWFCSGGTVHAEIWQEQVTRNSSQSCGAAGSQNCPTMTSRLPCYVFFLCMLTTQQIKNQMQISWVGWSTNIRPPRWPSSMVLSRSLVCTTALLEPELSIRAVSGAHNSFQTVPVGISNSQGESDY